MKFWSDSLVDVDEFTVESLTGDVIPIRNRNHTGERFIQSQLQVEETISVLFLSQIGINIRLENTVLLLIDPSFFVMKL